MKGLSITLLLLLVAVVSSQSYRTNLTLQRGLHRTVPEHITGSTVSLNGGITRLGEYYATIEVDGQPFNVQIDTGSSMLAIPSDRCSNCVSASHTSYNTSAYPMGPCGLPQCDHTIRYADGTGVDYTLRRRTVTLHTTTVDAYTGLITREIGRFGNFEVPGILGVASRMLNPFAVETVMDHITDTHEHANDTSFRDVFALCLTPYGGAWDIGYINESRAISPLSYHDARAYPGFYAIRITHVVLLPSVQSGVKRVTFETGSIPGVVDSGTTLLVLPYTILAGILAHIYHNRLPGYQDIRHGGECAILQPSDLQMYPALMLTYSNGGEHTLLLTVTPEMYFIPFQGQMCLGMAGTADSVIIIGDVVLQSFYTVFDRENNRVGFAPVNPENCPGGTQQEIQRERTQRIRRLAMEKMAEAWRSLLIPVLTLDPLLGWIVVFVLIASVLFESTKTN